MNPAKVRRAERLRAARDGCLLVVAVVVVTATLVFVAWVVWLALGASPAPPVS